MWGGVNGLSTTFKPFVLSKWRDSSVVEVRVSRPIISCTTSNPFIARDCRSLGPGFEFPSRLTASFFFPLENSSNL